MHHEGISLRKSASCCQFIGLVMLRRRYKKGKTITKIYFLSSCLVGFNPVGFYIVVEPSIANLLWLFNSLLFHP